MSVFSGFKREMPHRGEQKRQLLFVVRSLIGLPQRLDENKSSLVRLHLGPGAKVQVELVISHETIAVGAFLRPIASSFDRSTPPFLLTGG